MRKDACAPCRVLNGAASSVLPHLGLQRVSRQRIPSAGSLSNWHEYYRCLDCSTRLKREIHASQPLGRWLHDNASEIDQDPSRAKARQA